MIITLCGSARFEVEFKAWTKDLTLSGHVVHTLAVYPSDEEKGKDWYTPKEKEMLDVVYLQKIDSSEAILVLNVGEYIGEGTRREIDYARQQCKRIYFLHDDSDDAQMLLNSYKIKED